MSQYNGQSGLKRKAESRLPSSGRPEKSSRSSTSQKSTPTPSAKSSTAARPSTNGPSSASRQTPVNPVESKPPPKGSYADIIAKAQALQTKAPTNLGLIRHQSAQKERLSKLQQKRLAKEGKQQEGKKDGKVVGGRGAGTAAGKLAAVKTQREKPAEPEYRGTARPPPPREPVYKGTAGRPPRPLADKPKGKLQARPSRRDEYLATDEEDEGEFYDEPNEYFSDESEDMEAGYGDMFNEEAAAARIARREDEEQEKLEAALKKEKLERKKKLMQLSSARR